MRLWCGRAFGVTRFAFPLGMAHALVVRVIELDLDIFALRDVRCRPRLHHSENPLAEGVSNFSTARDAIEQAFDRHDDGFAGADGVTITRAEDREPALLDANVFDGERRVLHGTLEREYVVWPVDRGNPVDDETRHGVSK